MPNESLARFNSPAALAGFAVSLAATGHADFKAVLIEARLAGEPESETIFLAGGSAVIRHARKTGLHPVCKVTLDQKKRSLTIHGDGEKPGRFTLVSEEKINGPHELLRAVPAPPPSNVDHVVLKLDDLSIFPRVVEESLALDRGEMSFAKLDDDAVLLRINDPSYYLLRKWNEDLPAQVVTEFYPADGSGMLYIERGFALPVERRAMELPDGALYFLCGKGWIEWPLPEWRDIYEAARLDLAGAKSETWRTSADTPQFTITLRLAESGSKSEPELWRIPENELWRLEKLLGIIPEGELNNVQISMQRDSRDENYFFVRELIAGKTRRHLRFPGVAFATFEGYSNLYLPLGTAFEPRVRADRYREIFRLKDDRVTVIIPEASEPGAVETFSIIEFEAASFRPLSRLVDYICARNAEALQRVVDATVFDFSPYNYTGPPILLKERAVPPPRETSAEAAEPDDAVTSRRGEKAERRAPAERETRERGELLEPAQSSPLDLLAEKKMLLEETVTFEPSAVDSWIELADHKRRYDNAIDEALRCFEEGIWHEDDPGAVKNLLDRFLGFIESIPKQGPAWQSVPREIKDEIEIRREILRFLSNAPSDGKSRAAWIKDTSNRLRGSSLPKKARWILWQEICRLTGDKIGAETARENIRTELNRSGLLERDSFSFISRHMLARFGSKATERRTDLEMLLRHVRVAMETIEEPDYRSIVRSILAKCYLEFGDPDRCRAELKTAVGEARKAVKNYGSARPKRSSHSIDKAYKARAVVLSNLAGSLGRLHDGDAEKVFSQAARTIGELRGSAAAENEEALRRLLENVEFTNSPDRHRDVLDGFWEIFENIPPDRQQICLCDCAPVLLRLGEGGRGADAALSLLTSRDRYHALYARRHAIEALVIFMADRQLDDETALKLLGDGVERREEMAEHIIYYIDGLLTLAPEAGADYLLKRIPKPDPRRKNKMYDLLIHSCVARALAAADDHDKAYETLADIIAASGQLDRHQRVSVLRHVITSLRLCGRPKSSIKLLRSLQDSLQQEGNLVFTAPVLFEAIETIVLLAESADEMRRIQGVIRMLKNIDLDPGQFWEVQKALISCVRSIRNWVGKEGELEAAYQLIVRIGSSVNKFFASQPRRSQPAIFYHGSALIGIADALVYLGRDSEAATVFSEALRILPQASPQDRDELSADLVEAVSQMETRYQVQVLLKLLETFPRLVRKGLGSPRLKDSVLPKIVDIALMGEPLFKAKLREREGLVIQNIRKRLRTDRISK